MYLLKVQKVKTFLIFLNAIFTAFSVLCLARQRLCYCSIISWVSTRSTKSITLTRIGTGPKVSGVTIHDIRVSF